jgi:hypothetical protein
VARPSKIYIFFNLCGGTLGTAATTGLLYQPWMIGDGACGEIGGMNVIFLHPVALCNLN